MRTVIRGARVLSMDGAGTDLPRATVTIEDDTIVAVDAVDAVDAMVAVPPAAAALVPAVPPNPSALSAWKSECRKL